MKARTILASLAVALLLPAAASASTTLGSIVEPGGEPNVSDCSSAVGVLGQATSAYEVGPNAGIVTSWSVNATGDGSGTETLYVLAPSTAGYTVVGLDTETLPATIPLDGTVTFNLANPIQTTTGDTFGLSATGAGPVNCAWSVGDTPETDLGFVAGPFTAFPTVGQTFAATLVEGESTVPSLLVDLSVTLSQGPEDAAVTTATGPGNAAVGNEALLSSTVTNNGPYMGPATFTDSVPTGLTVDAAAAADGTCTTAGQLVTCTFANLAVGASAPVEIVVTPTAAAAYENNVSVTDATGTTDPNPANNTASATLTVSAPTVAAARACVTTNVKGLSEKVVKRLLSSFGCKLGKIKKATSKKVAKGDVISLKPGSGSHPAGTKVTLTVSSGKPKKKHKG